MINSVKSTREDGGLTAPSLARMRQGQKTSRQRLDTLKSDQRQAVDFQPG